MYRLNVAAEQFDECVKEGMFALSSKPKISAGELLLLQLKKEDWKLKGATGGRIEYALVFQRCEYDQGGKISKEHWPNAGKTWQWILYSSAVLNVTPFSLENLPLVRKSHYQAQSNPVKIEPEDETIILPYIHWPSIVPFVANAVQSSEDGLFATSEEAKKIEELSILYAVAEVKKYYPRAQVEVMNHNNPGFDILVTENGRVIRYVEVKGTKANKPIFHLTETERKFSETNSPLYSLLVVWMIDKTHKTCKVAKYDGEVSVGPILKPFTYVGQLSD
jgi:hypothetical protein